MTLTGWPVALVPNMPGKIAPDNFSVTGYDSHGQVDNYVMSALR